MACYGLATASSRGVGRALAEAQASLSCSLVVASRSIESLRAAAREISEAYGVEVLPVKCDMRSKSDVEKLLESAFEWFGRLDYVTLSYGNPSREPLYVHEAEWEDWIEAAQLYLASTALVIKKLVELNPARALLLAVTSFSVAEPMSPLVVSDATRAGLSRILKVAARSYPDKLRTILLVLGSFETPGAKRTIEALARSRGEDPRELWRREVEARSPLRRAGSLAELRDFVAGLLRSPEYLTGAVVLFDGASSRTAWP
ncbi:MAG: SDR family oxidoreductase [Acidilobaceae archaeon]